MTQTVNKQLHWTTLYWFIKWTISFLRAKAATAFSAS